MLEIIFTPKGRNIIFAIAGGTNPKISFLEMGFTDEQLEACLPAGDYLKHLEEEQYDYWGSLTRYSSLYLLFSEDKPLILFTAEGGEFDTCLEIFLKYGDGQRPNLDELLEMRTCMDNYDGDINAAVNKVEKLMEIMFPEKLYEFEHCTGVMSDLWGNFTWDRYQDHNRLPCSSPWNHVRLNFDGLKLSEDAFLNGSNKEKLHRLKAICLVASQPTEAFSKERVEYYRQQIKNGKSLGCIAYKIPEISNYAIILDGHHRVIASMLEGVFPDCLLITEASYRLDTKKEQTILNLNPPDNITKKNPGITGLPEKILGILNSKATFHKEVIEEGNLMYYKYYRSNAEKSNTCFPKEYEPAVKNILSKIAKI
jgi:hypothetical protein